MTTIAARGSASPTLTMVMGCTPSAGACGSAAENAGSPQLITPPTRQQAPSTQLVAQVVELVGSPSAAAARVARAAATRS